MKLFTVTLFLMLHLLPPLTTAENLKTIKFSQNNSLTCSQGLTDCKVNPGYSCINHDNGVYVTDLAAEALLCHSHKGWLPCLRIKLNITAKGFHEDTGLSGEANHEDERDEHKEEELGSSLGYQTVSSTSVSVQVCYSIPEFSGSRKITFSMDTSTEQMWISLVVELKKVHFGSSFTIFSSESLKHHFSKHITLPSVESVCSQGIPLCKVPVLRKEVNHTSGMVKLTVDPAGRSKLNELLACQRMEKEGDCSALEWNNPLMIPLSSAAPCLCFQVWWKNTEGEKAVFEPRMEICPFLNDTALSNVSVTVVEQRQTRDSDRTGHANSTTLVWNITAPCRLDAELQLCKKTSWSDSSCHEIHDLRKTRIHVHSHFNPKWKNLKQQWLFQGEFPEVERHPSLCVKIKVKGLEGHFKPVCPFAETRTHWSFVLLICVVLICLTVLGAYAVQGSLKGWVFRWLKVDDIRAAVGGSHVVLLYPPDAESGLAELVCRLGSGLSSLGFSVSLDLWSRSELSALGPVPWLHSRLDRVQRNGGKVVLVLTQAAWARAEEWGRRAGARVREEHTGEKEKEDSSLHASSSGSYDVFSASLSCILADYLQGRAGERFILAQFEAHPAGPPGSGESLPELFRGLPLFSLPSQSLGFLTELTNGTQKKQAGKGANRRMRAGVLRAGSRALTETLRELKGGTGYRLVGLSQGFRAEDPWESIPLHQGLSSPTASPELHVKSSTVNWV
ncbi:interleukin-17 receptor C [Hoplias malabaricus]|uniref:interleukin-17 receptor C n=1 Tax=Hoplias malabaricus TaxID=27720 RepID=UPI00346278D4